jgi:hypothetical protein
VADVSRSYLFLERTATPEEICFQGANPLFVRTPPLSDSIDEHASEFWLCSGLVFIETRRAKNARSARTLHSQSNFACIIEAEIEWRTNSEYNPVMIRHCTGAIVLLSFASSWI